MKKFIIICTLLSGIIFTHTAFAQSAPEAAPAVTPPSSTDSMVNPIDQAPSNLPDGSMEPRYPYPACDDGTGNVCGDSPDMSWLGALAVFIIPAIIGLVGFIFWLWMFIHAIKHPITNKVVWIICFIFFGFLTAVVYYFVIKRSFVSVTPPAGVPPTPQV